MSELKNYNIILNETQILQLVECIIYKKIDIRENIDRTKTCIDKPGHDNKHLELEIQENEAAIKELDIISDILNPETGTKYCGQCGNSQSFEICGECYPEEFEKRYGISESKLIERRIHSTEAHQKRNYSRPR